MMTGISAVDDWCRSFFKTEMPSSPGSMISSMISCGVRVRRALKRSAPSEKHSASKPAECRVYIIKSRMELSSSTQKIIWVCSFRFSDSLQPAGGTSLRAFFHLEKNPLYHHNLSHFLPSAYPFLQRHLCLVIILPGAILATDADMPWMASVSSVGRIFAKVMIRLCLRAGRRCVSCPSPFSARKKWF